MGDGPVEALEALEIDAGEARAAPVGGRQGPPVGSRIEIGTMG